MGQNPNPGGQARVEGEPPSYQPQPPPSPGYVPPSYPGYPEPTRRWDQAQMPPQPPPPMAAQPWVRDRRPHHTPVLGPILLIGAGLVFLLINMGVLDESVWSQLFQLWPLLLIAIGLDLLLGRRNPVLSLLIVLLVLGGGAALLYYNGGLRPAGHAAGSPVSVPLNGAKSADVHLDLGISALAVDTLNGATSQLVTGQLGYIQDQQAPVPQVTRNGDTIQLRLSQKITNLNFWPFSRSGGDLSWNLHFNPLVPMKLDANTGTGTVDMDLTDSKVTNLNLSTGTGSVTLVFPSNAGSTTALVNGGVGSIDLAIPQDVDARITVKTGIGSVDVDNRFARQPGDVYQSTGYTHQPKNKLDLTIDAGIGSVSVNSK